MRHVLVWLAGLTLIASSGCQFEKSETQANRRMGELLNGSDEPRVSSQENPEERSPHLTVDRVHGGITPGQEELIAGQ
jgi:hypothetical protein